MMFQALQKLTPADASKDIDWVALLELLPALTPLATTPQDPIWHAEGDVWTHTRMVCERIMEMPEFQAADADRRFVLFYSCLLHDIGKPACTETTSEGRVTSAGHSRRGAIDARVLLWRAGTPFGLREQICRIIAAHQLPFYAIQGDRSGNGAEFLVRKLSWEVCIRDLVAVARADTQGRICAESSDAMVNTELFAEMAREESCFESPRAFPDAHTRMRYFATEGNISPDHAFFAEPGSRVTVLSGLPASGKDTWVQKHAGARAVVSFDDACEELGVKYGTDAAGAAVHLVIDRAKELLRKKAPFVWNATNLSRQMRKKTLDLLYNYGAEVEIVYLEGDEKAIKRRNTKRDTTLSNAAIDKMLHKWEVPLPSEAHEVQYLPSSVT
jgi:predicted kinase